MSAPSPGPVVAIFSNGILSVVRSYQLTTLASVLILHFTDHQDNMHYFYLEDGWIYHLTTRQKLCWIPVNCRGELASSGKCIALGTLDGRVVILDFSGILVRAVQDYD